MPAPRPPIRLVERDLSIRVEGVNDPSLDVTAALHKFGTEFARSHQNLCGYVLMDRSPSCGVQGVKVYREDGSEPERRGTGMFAQAITNEVPLVPLEDASHLFEREVQEHFLTRVSTYAHWQMLTQHLSAQALLEFHSRYKYLLMAYSIPAYKQCGRLLSDVSKNLHGLSEQYIFAFMQGIRRPVTVGGHANVLAHLQGYLKRQLRPKQRQEMDKQIQAFRQGEVELTAVQDQLLTHFDRFPNDYVGKQYYFRPYVVPHKIKTTPTVPD